MYADYEIFIFKIENSLIRIQKYVIHIILYIEDREFPRQSMKNRQRKKKDVLALSTLLRNQRKTHHKFTDTIVLKIRGRILNFFIDPSLQ